MGDFFGHFLGHFGSFSAILKMPPLCQKSLLARKIFIFAFLSSYITTMSKIRKIGEMSLSGFGTLSQKVGLNFVKKIFILFCCFRKIATDL